MFIIVSYRDDVMVCMYCHEFRSRKWDWKGNVTIELVISEGSCCWNMNDSCNEVIRTNVGNV